jgi:hypothetical protein
VIYLTPPSNYFVPDSATQQQGQTAWSNATWVIGDQTAAEAQLTINQQQMLTSSSEHFSQVKSIGQDADGQNVWIACDINSEPANSDVLYELFCDVQPGFQLATGTAQALQVYQAQQQAVLQWAGLGAIITLDAIPTPPKKK